MEKVVEDGAIEAIAGRVTRARRKRIGSVESDASLSRPTTPLPSQSKMDAIIENSQTKRMTRRNSTNTPVKTPLKSKDLENIELTGTPKRSTRRRSVSAAIQEEAAAAAQILLKHSPQLITLEEEAVKENTSYNKKSPKGSIKSMEPKTNSAKKSLKKVASPKKHVKINDDSNKKIIVTEIIDLVDTDESTENFSTSIVETKFELTETKPEQTKSISDTPDKGKFLCFKSTTFDENENLAERKSTQINTAAEKDSANNTTLTDEKHQKSNDFGSKSSTTTFSGVSPNKSAKAEQNESVNSKSTNSNENESLDKQKASPLKTATQKVSANNISSADIKDQKSTSPTTTIHDFSQNKSAEIDQSKTLHFISTTSDESESVNQPRASPLKMAVKKVSSTDNISTDSKHQKLNSINSTTPTLTFDDASPKKSVKTDYSNSASSDETKILDPPKASPPKTAAEKVSSATNISSTDTNNQKTNSVSSTGSTIAFDAVSPNKSAETDQSKTLHSISASSDENDSLNQPKVSPHKTVTEKVSSATKISSTDTKDQKSTSPATAYDVVSPNNSVTAEQSKSLHFKSVTFDKNEKLDKPKANPLNTTVEKESVLSTENLDKIDAEKESASNISSTEKKYQQKYVTNVALFDENSPNKSTIAEQSKSTHSKSVTFDNNENIEIPKASYPKTPMMFKKSPVVLGQRDSKSKRTISMNLEDSVMIIENDEDEMKNCKITPNKLKPKMIMSTPMVDDAEAEIDCVLKVTPSPDKFLCSGKKCSESPTEKTSSSSKTLSPVGKDDVTYPERGTKLSFEKDEQESVSAVITKSPNDLFKTSATKNPETLTTSNIAEEENDSCKKNSNISNEIDSISTTCSGMEENSAKKNINSAKIVKIAFDSKTSTASPQKKNQSVFKKGEEFKIDAKENVMIEEKNEEENVLNETNQTSRSYPKSWTQSLKQQSEKIDSIKMLQIHDDKSITDNLQAKSIQSPGTIKKISQEYVMNVEINDQAEKSEEEDDYEQRNQSCFVNDEAECAGYDYQSGDSMNTEEREGYEENHIKSDIGESIGSDDTNSIEEDEESDEKDSFVVSDDDDESELFDSLNDNENLKEELISKKYKRILKTASDSDETNSVNDEQHQNITDEHIERKSDNKVVKQVVANTTKEKKAEFEESIKSSEEISKKAEHETSSATNKTLLDEQVLSNSAACEQQISNASESFVEIAEQKDLLMSSTSKVQKKRSSNVVVLNSLTDSNELGKEKTQTLKGTNVSMLEEQKNLSITASTTQEKTLNSSEDINFLEHSEPKSSSATNEHVETSLITVDQPSTTAPKSTVEIAEMEDLMNSSKTQKKRRSKNLSFLTDQNDSNKKEYDDEDLNANDDENLLKKDYRIVTVAEDHQPMTITVEIHHRSKSSNDLAANELSNSSITSLHQKRRSSARPTITEAQENETLDEKLLTKKSHNVQCQEFVSNLAETGNSDFNEENSIDDEITGSEDISPKSENTNESERSNTSVYFSSGTDDVEENELRDLLKATASNQPITKSSGRKTLQLAAQTSNNNQQKPTRQSLHKINKEKELSKSFIECLNDERNRKKKLISSGKRKLSQSFCGISTTPDIQQQIKKQKRDITPCSWDSTPISFKKKKSLDKYLQRKLSSKKANESIMKEKSISIEHDASKICDSYKSENLKKCAALSRAIQVSQTLLSSKPLKKSRKKIASELQMKEHYESKRLPSHLLEAIATTSDSTSRKRRRDETVEQHTVVYKTNAGTVVETEVEPPRAKKQKHILEILKTTTGDFLVEPSSPVSKKKNRWGFHESPITPINPGWKIKKRLEKGNSDKKQRQGWIKNKTGLVKVEKINVAKQLISHDGTQFKVVTSYGSSGRNQNLPSGASERAHNFYQTAMNRSSVKREDYRCILRRKK